jgi:hypothetical protein
MTTAVNCCRISITNLVRAKTRHTCGELVLR